jgi:putative Holliday junction resolvase
LIISDIKQFLNMLDSGKRLLSLDVGSKKIGLALSDTMRSIATPMTVLIRKGFNKDLEAIILILKEHEITGLVIGLPVMMNGNEGDACITIRELATKLSEKYPINIYLQDERLSTSEANRMLSQTNLTRKKKNLIDDKIAACIILQGLLDQINYIKQL